MKEEQRVERRGALVLLDNNIINYRNSAFSLPTWSLKWQWQMMSFTFVYIKKCQYLKVKDESEHAITHVRPQTRERYKSIWVSERREGECGAFIPTIHRDTWICSKLFLSIKYSHRGEMHCITQVPTDLRLIILCINTGTFCSLNSTGSTLINFFFYRWKALRPLCALPNITRRS